MRRIFICLMTVGFMFSVMTFCRADNYDFSIVMGAYGESLPVFLTGINDSGQTVGLLYTSNEAFIGTSNGIPVKFLQSRHGGLFPTEINDLGEVVGTVGSGVSGFLYSTGTYVYFTFPGSTEMTPLAINDSGEIAGYYELGGVVHGFIYSNGAFDTVDFPGASSTDLMGINSAGQVVGNYGNQYDTEGFLDDHGVFTSIDFPNAIGTSVVGISDSGQIAGLYMDRSGHDHGFLYGNGVYSSLDYPGGSRTDLRNMTALGKVFGTFACGDYFQGYFVATPAASGSGSCPSPAPEPGTFPTLGTGIIALGLLLLFLKRRASDI